MSDVLDSRAIRALSLGMISAYFIHAKCTLKVLPDGGYVNVFSALIVLRELLHRKRRLNGLRDVSLPSDTFDIMSGTGMGG